MLMDLCKSCGRRPIQIAKRSLCMACYQKLRRASGGNITQGKQACPATMKKRENEAEIAFIRSYFDHNEWAHQPVIFRFSIGSSYTPDFYDKRRNVFIEVVGTMQAYHYNKSKYDLMRSEYPQIGFEIRKSDGSLLDEDSERLSWEGTEQFKKQVASN